MDEPANTEMIAEGRPEQVYVEVSGYSLQTKRGCEQQGLWFPTGSPFEVLHVTPVALEVGTRGAKVS